MLTAVSHRPQSSLQRMGLDTLKQGQTAFS
jgi:hypothetical protein